eukprot:Sspe_Gene.109304::Locus_89165_Transcript_1_1_Confidence_1.000_Length_725::g.109304::m.109304
MVSTNMNDAMEIDGLRPLEDQELLKPAPKQGRQSRKTPRKGAAKDVAPATPEVKQPAEEPSTEPRQNVEQQKEVTEEEVNRGLNEFLNEKEKEKQQKRSRDDDADSRTSRSTSSSAKRKKMIPHFLTVERITEAVDSVNLSLRLAYFRENYNGDSSFTIEGKDKPIQYTTYTHQEYEKGEKVLEKIVLLLEDDVAR